MTKKQKVTYKTVNGKLSIEHHMLLQQLTFRKSSNNGEIKVYYSYFIKLPKAVYDLLNLSDDTVYLKQVNDKIILLDTKEEDTKKVKIQLDNKSITDNVDDYRYKLTIPKKFIDTTVYKRGESYINCRITSTDNTKGYEITLRQD